MTSSKCLDKKRIINYNKFMKKKFDLKGALTAMSRSWPRPNGELVFHVESDHVWLHKIRLPSSHRGQGTRLMADFLALTDKANLPVCLTADPIEEGLDPLKHNPNTYDLVKWYCRFGFKALCPSEDGFLMERQPAGLSAAQILDSYQKNKEKNDLSEENFKNLFPQNITRTLGPS